VRPFTSTIALDEARRRLDAAARPIVRVETIPLAHAFDRVAAADIVATLDVPPFSRSAMDGYAVAAIDVAGATAESPARLSLAGRVFTGEHTIARAGNGACVEIATGAPMPGGADAVVMVEDTAREGDVILVKTPVSTGQNVGHRGADISNGDRIIAAGDHLTPSRVGAIAAIGCANISAFARVRVAILSTGNEVVEPGQTLLPGHIYDVNRYTLGAIVSAHGGIPEPKRAAQDTVPALAAALDACADADLIIFSGGSSVGDRDLVADLIAARGTMIFHGVAIRPGKPTAFAIVDGKPFFGMPGNPTSCLSNAYLLLVPFLRAVARLPPYVAHTTTVPLGRRIASAPGRHQIYTVRVEHGVAMPAFKGSGDITSLSQADGYIEIPATEEAVQEGKEVKVTLF